MKSRAIFSVNILTAIFVAVGIYFSPIGCARADLKPGDRAVWTAPITNREVKILEISPDGRMVKIEGELIGPQWVRNHRSDFTPL